MLIAVASWARWSRKYNKAPGRTGAVRAGPGLWLDWLDELDRKGLLEGLLAGGAITRTLREAPHGHSYDRTLTGKMTVICVLTASLFPGAGYDMVLATAFGLPGLHPRPLLRIAAHVRAVTRRWIAAAIGGYLDGENPLADDLEGSFTAGILNLADRGFFSMDRWIRFSAAGLPGADTAGGELVTWYEHSRSYTEAKWPNLAPVSCRSVAKALVTVTIALTAKDRGAPEPSVLRRALFGWAFNPPPRDQVPPPQIAAALDWATRACLPVAALEDTATARRALDACARTLTGRRRPGRRSGEPEGGISAA